MSQFWTGGPGAYEKGLAEEARAKIADLRKRLKTAETQAEEEKLREQIRQVEKEYEEKLRAIGRCRF